MTRLRAEFPTLPGQAIRLIEAVGYGPALSLLRKRGGTRVRVPRATQECSMLMESLGSVEAVEQFAQEFSDQEYVTLPKAKKIVALMRDRNIREQRAHGASIAVLALRYDLTRAWVYKILREDLPVVDSTPDLFDA